MLDLALIDAQLDEISGAESPPPPRSRFRHQPLSTIDAMLETLAVGDVTLPEDDATIENHRRMAPLESMTPQVMIEEASESMIPEILAAPGSSPGARAPESGSIAPELSEDDLFSDVPEPDGGYDGQSDVSGLIQNPYVPGDAPPDDGIDILTSVFSEEEVDMIKRLSSTPPDPARASNSDSFPPLPDEFHPPEDVDPNGILAHSASEVPTELFEDDFELLISQVDEYEEDERTEAWNREPAAGPPPPVPPLDAAESDGTEKPPTPEPPGNGEKKGGFFKKLFG